MFVIWFIVGICIILLFNKLCWNIKTDNEKFTQKIDGVIAITTALYRVTRCGNDINESVYDYRGLLIF